MPFSETAGRRYLALFQLYGAGRSPELDGLKRHIVEYRARLRLDAMYFLLVNLDHMVLLPLSGYIPDPAEQAVGFGLATPQAPDEVAGKAHDAIRYIMERLGRRDELFSAFDVVDAINGATAYLNELFDW